VRQKIAEQVINESTFELKTEGSNSLERFGISGRNNKTIEE